MLRKFNHISKKSSRYYREKVHNRSWREKFFDEELGYFNEQEKEFGLNLEFYVGWIDRGVMSFILEIE